jgi:acetolactate synthase I/II/III large subunit
MLSSTQRARLPVVAVRPLRVLLVDDDGLQLRAIARPFRGHAQVEVITADNAIDALLLIGSENPDLVVMDVYMPGLDGLEACRRIKANPATRHVHVVLASAAMSDELATSARSAGATRAITKPIDIAALLGPELGPEPEPAPPALVPHTVRGADLVIDMLEAEGVEVVFGLPGGAISPIHDALIDSSIRTITTRHESGAMFAAAAYARTTGKLAVVAVTSGPGVLNAMTGLASAWCDGVPVLLLVGEVPRQAHGKGVLQDGSAHGLQIVEMARHVTKLALEVPSPSTLPHLVRRAIVTARSGRRGPVALTLPLDVTTAQVAPPQTGGSVAVDGFIEPETLDELAELLRTARRPLILAGNGVRGGGAPMRLRAVAEHFSVPVATTPKGKGVFPEDHALALGVLGLGGHPSARDYLQSGIDIVVAIGTSLGDLATDAFVPQLQATRALVHVDIDARQIGKSYSPTHAIVASAAELLGGLVERHVERGLTRSPIPNVGIRRCVLPSSVEPDRVAAHDILRELQRALPDNTIFTVDSGEHFVAAVHFLHITHPDAFLVMTGLGSMGQSIGAALGAQLAQPKRMVVAICGDGCFAMNAFEIATAVAERLPIRVFVFNDQRLGMCEDGHRTVYGRSPAFPTAPLDVCTIARGLGATTLRVDRVEQIRDAEHVLLHTEGPVVVDVRIDPAIVVPKRDRVAAMAPGSTTRRVVN